MKTLAAAKSGSQIGNEFTAIDTALLFQRISVVFRGDEERTRKAFEYELSAFPMSLFDKLGFMR